MPFTFSHPAIILPLTLLPKKWFSLTGLVIGSLTPDFEYFLRMKVQSNYSHTLTGLFWFDLPFGILLTFIFHNIVRNVLFDNLPVVLKSRLFVFKSFNWNNYFTEHWFVVAISVLIGAISHIFLDSFTHEHGCFVKTIPILTKTISCYSIPFPMFKLLQHSSTLIGSIVIAIVLLKLPKEAKIFMAVSIKYWVILLGLTFAIISLRLLSGLDYRLYGHLIVTAISAGIISLILTPILINFRKT
jgi:Domain of unknown function (DUF4184)